MEQPNDQYPINMFLTPVRDAMINYRKSQLEEHLRLQIYPACSLRLSSSPGWCGSASQEKITTTNLICTSSGVQRTVGQTSLSREPANGQEVVVKLLLLAFHYASRHSVRHQTYLFHSLQSEPDYSVHLHIRRAIILLDFETSPPFFQDFLK